MNFIKSIKNTLKNLLLFLFTIVICLLFIEGALRAYKHNVGTMKENILSEKNKQAKSINIPDELKKRYVEIEGADSSYYWIGKLHVKKWEGIRRTTDFLPKNPNIFRIMAIGDSLTYGQGVAEEDTYCSVLERKLRKKHRVEVINLGRNGANHREILKLLKKYTPIVKPDLVIYGVCLNDFLPEQPGQYKNNMAYQFPIPRRIKQFLTENTLLGELAAKGYNNLLLELKVRDNFESDILKNFRKYQDEFAASVMEMNNYCVGRNLPSIVAMILDQFPSLDSENHKIALIAEKYLSDAKMNIIPCMEYLRQYDGFSLSINKWEGHPNEQAHEIFANYFEKALIEVPILARYKINE